LKILLVFIFAAFFLQAPSLLAKDNDSVFFFRSEKVYEPLEAGILEARIGFQKYTNTDYLKLDIGASLDVVALKSGDKIFSAGADFFTFSNLRTESNFKFPVDAIDYFFGINLNFRTNISKDRRVSARFRLSHISSHLEDGHVYERTDTIFTPFVFSKEFIDLSAIYEFDASKNLLLRAQGGLNYIFHSIPDEISPLSGQIGLEARYYLTDILSLYISNEVTISEVYDATNANENLETGISLGNKNSRGITVYFNYYDGQDFRGQYYGSYLNTKGIGMKLKF
jgi:hypothetical protein